MTNLQYISTNLAITNKLTNFNSTHSTTHN